MPTGYQVTRLPVIIVIHNVYATDKIMVTKHVYGYILSYFKKNAYQLATKLPGCHAITFVIHNVYATTKVMITKRIILTNIMKNTFWLPSYQVTSFICKV